YLPSKSEWASSNLARVLSRILTLPFSLLITDVYSLMRLANSLGSSSSSLSSSLSHTLELPLAMRHIGGGGSDGSSFVRSMVTMSSSSLDSSLDETSVTHSCFSTKKLLLVCPFFFGKSLVFLSWLFFFPSLLFLFFLSSSSSLESLRCLLLLSLFLLSGLGQFGRM